MEMTSRQSDQVTFLTQMYGLLGRLVRMSRLQEGEPEFTETEVDSFLTSLTSSKAKKKKIDPNGLSSKMLKAFSTAMQDGTSSIISVNWPKLGMMSSGRFSTLKTTECLKTESECTLSDILEAEVDEKYYLSAQKAVEILSKL